MRLDPKIVGHLYGKGARDCWCLGFIQKPYWGVLEAGGLNGTGLKQCTGRCSGGNRHLLPTKPDTKIGIYKADNLRDPLKVFINNSFDCIFIFLEIHMERVH